MPKAISSSTKAADAESIVSRGGDYEISGGFECRPIVLPHGMPTRNWDYFFPF